VKRKVSAVDARKRLGEILESVYYRGDEVVIERAGKPMAVFIPVSRYQEMEASRDRVMELIEMSHEKNKDVPYEVIERVVRSGGRLPIAEVQVFDLSLMDIRLPDIDGYEAMRRIKAKPALRATPLIVVTSYALSGDEAKALTAGADAYVSKPFSPRALLAKIREFLPP